MKIQRHSAGLGRVETSWLEAGGPEGAPVLLLHGFASSADVNWRLTGWIDMLAGAGRRVVAPDHRGHGASQKFYAAPDYGPDIFAADAVALLDHLQIGKADVVGYSMGARVALWMAAHHANRVGRAVICGMGEHMFGGRGNNETIAEGLETDRPQGIQSDTARTFRRFAERTGSDLKALAACIRPSRTRLTPDDARAVSVPTLIAVGTDDEVAGDPQPLADLVPTAEVFRAAGRDHMKATGAPEIKRAVLEFLDRP